VASYGSLQEVSQTLLGLTLSSHHLESFEIYASELIAWNKRVNLTAITDPKDIEVKHFLDSLTCLRVIGLQPEGKLIDIGSGAGFPGLPLKITCPQLKVTLIESIGKKVEFCHHIVKRLRLKGVEIFHDRAERLGRQDMHRQAYDWAVARAVAAIPVLAEYALPFLRLGGRAIIMKGETGPAEAHAAESALQLLGGRVSQLIPLELPQIVETRYLVLVDKVAATPAKYPRRPGIPEKRPVG
jgi:16S rRNA (guanine527-N7)-methyltransferase